MTQKLIEAAQQALEALEKTGIEGTWLLHEEAITALREALAKQAEQEPVAWKDMAFARLGVVRDKMRPDDVAVVQRFLDGDYAAPVRTKDLTDDEIVDASGIGCALPNEIDRFRAVIAADREKNNGC